MTKPHKALAGIMACVFFWGFSFVSTKIALVFFPPMILAALRFGLAVIFLWFLKKGSAPNEKMQKSDLPLLAGAGLFGATMYFSFENKGLTLIPASEASIITAAIPILTLIAERAEERILSLRGRKGRAAGSAGRDYLVYKIVIPGAGAVISLTGVILVAGVSFSISGAARGYLFMVGACFSWVIYCFLTRPLFARHSRIFIVFWQSLIGFLGFLPSAFYEAFLGNHFEWRMPGPGTWCHILFLGICCSALGYSFYARALEALGPGAASLFLNFVPVISVVGGYFVLGERMRPLQFLGGALVLAGVYLAMSVNGRKAAGDKERHDQ